GATGCSPDTCPAGRTRPAPRRPRCRGASRNSLGRGPEPNPQPRAVTHVIVRPAAARDIEQAYQWYDSRRPGLGEEPIKSSNERHAESCAGGLAASLDSGADLPATSGPRARDARASAAERYGRGTADHCTAKTPDLRIRKW